MTLWYFILIIIVLNNLYLMKDRFTLDWILWVLIILHRNDIIFTFKTTLIFITTCFATYQWYPLAKICTAKIPHFCYYKLFSNRRWVLEKTPQHALFNLATPCCSIWNGSKCTCGLFNKCLFILNRPRMILATRFD